MDVSNNAGSCPERELPQPLNILQQKNESEAASTCRTSLSFCGEGRGNVELLCRGFGEIQFNFKILIINQSNTLIKIIRLFLFNYLDERMGRILFLDLEVSESSGKIVDVGAISSDNEKLHVKSIGSLLKFIEETDFICGHNILAHDLEYIAKNTPGVISEQFKSKAIDTLLLSPLLFPRKPYHHLVKDDKLQTEELNNPLNDSIKARDLFYDQVNVFENLEPELKLVFFNLLYKQAGFKSFFEYIGYKKVIEEVELVAVIWDLFKNKICEHSSIVAFIKETPIALAYSLALINCSDDGSITPPWVLRNYPETDRLLFLLRNNPCITGCDYCSIALNPYLALKEHFGFSSFRSYGEEPLQENAVNAAISNKSILAIFPTGGGKSITFQLPALMSGKNAKALTVIISPLQSLMKDQVDNLENRKITQAVTINGLLDPIERSKSIERVENGSACILYISPESLRSITIERLLLKRKIARFVIDEAHCFSSWGHDFRVDYLYIGEFISSLQKKKNLQESIPVSCFTATAKQKVIEDIKAYFKNKLNLQLDTFRADVSRQNLHYRVFKKDNEDDKYLQLRTIIESKNCPTIVYVSRTKRAYKLAQRLTDDGFSAKPYHGKMDKDEKTANQNAFMKGEVNVMVATSAFGMGVDKSDVGAVIHYDISDSLENYFQEAGRAGRDEKIEADCFVLFNEEDLDKHFILLNQTKISSKEINQIWKAIKELTRTRSKVSNSALEIARKAGWDDSIGDIETRVKTAIAALEESGYVARGQNNPIIFASSILCKTAQDAIIKINASDKFEDQQKVIAVRIIKKLFSSKSKKLSTEEQAESRVDYISDQLGIVKENVIRIIELLRAEKILADTKDLTAFIKLGENSNRSLSVVERYRKHEEYLLSMLKDGESSYNLKELNEGCIEAGIKDSTPNKLNTIITFWSIKNWIKRQTLEYSHNLIRISCTIPKEAIVGKASNRYLLAKIITQYLYSQANENKLANKEESEVLIEFSVQELKEITERELKGSLFTVNFTLDDIEDTLFYLSKIEAIKIEGGFLVVHNKLTIDRLERNNRIQYKESDYEKLALFYQQKVQQIHIVGEYAKKMIRNYEEALQFVDDYFNLNYSAFLNKYFPGSRQDEIKRTLTPEKFMKLFGGLSPAQLQIIKDVEHPYIVVAAGPGSGKTRVLVHKLASLLLTEDVKHEQLLMLTFSRSAATEFKKRLLELIGNAASFIEIKTFHSYCFDLLGRIGSLSQADSVLKTAFEKICNGDIEVNRLTKTVLVVDEAQDINADEYALIKSLMDHNEDMRVIFVGDDDQNIYEFRGSDSKYMLDLILGKKAVKYELTENYRSKNNIVSFANQWAATIQNRLKSQPGFSKNQQNGVISIFEYTSPNLIVPLVEKVRGTDLSGSTCVLTKTNDEAIQITGLLLQQNMPAKLIQTNDGFNLGNLFELRYFTEAVDRNQTSPLISDEEWISAKRSTLLHFSRSKQLPLLQMVINEFESVNKVRKYRSDWRSFLFESKIEDFNSANSDTIIVSTMHKAKGKEFDNVFLMLNDFAVSDNSSKRLLYVAMTRAKTNLSILYNKKYFSKFDVPGMSYYSDLLEHSTPQKISLISTLRDINLGYFEFIQHRLTGLQSGDSLTILNEGLGNTNGELIIKFSKNFCQVLELRKEKGFEVLEAKVNFIVYWKDEQKNVEVKVVLPELSLAKIK